LPFAIAGGLLAFVAVRLDFDAFVDHLADIDYAAYMAFALGFAIVLLLTDTLATAWVYRRILGPVGYRDFLVIRGASYVPSLLNHHVGQAWLTYYLSKIYGARLWRAAGATLLVYATTFGCLFVFASVSLILDWERFDWLPTVVAAVAVAGLIYLVVIRLRPAALTSRHLTAPLVEVGVRGHFVALAYRVPHMVVLFIGTWVPFLFFDVDVPLVDALALVPPLMIVVALPITPQGVGTRDSFALQLFAGFAVGSAGEQAAAVAAATISWAVAVTLIQIPMSLVFFRLADKLRLDGPAGSDE
jgi:hypothetical protein